MFGGWSFTQSLSGGFFTTALCCRHSYAHEVFDVSIPRRSRGFNLMTPHLTSFGEQRNILLAISNAPLAMHPSALHRRAPFRPPPLQDCAWRLCGVRMANDPPESATMQDNTKSQSLCCHKTSANRSCSLD